MDDRQLEKLISKLKQHNFEGSLPVPRSGGFTYKGAIASIPDAFDVFDTQKEASIKQAKANRESEAASLFREEFQGRQTPLGQRLPRIPSTSQELPLMDWASAPRRSNRSRTERRAAQQRRESTKDNKYEKHLTSEKRRAIGALTGMQQLSRIGSGSGGMAAGVEHTKERLGAMFNVDKPQEALGQGSSLGGELGLNPYALFIGQLDIASSKMREWTETLHNSNMELSKFSGPMAAVAARQFARDVKIQQLRGGMQAEAAEEVASAKSEADRMGAPRKAGMAGLWGKISQTASNLSSWWEKTQLKMGAGFQDIIAAPGEKSYMDEVNKYIEWAKKDKESINSNFADWIANTAANWEKNWGKRGD